MTVNRRTVLGGAAAMGLAPVLPATAQGTGPGGEMRARASTFLELLEPGQRDKVLFGFNDPQRKAWNFMLGARRAPGLALEEMTALQKDTALDLLAVATSKTGLQKAEHIMLQQDILRDEWNKGAPDRNRERFSLQIYGTPTAEGAWAWRWEGHHLSLTFTMVNDEVVSTTPSSFSSEPNTVPSGPHRGLVVLKEEEVLARRLYQDLTGAEARQALVSAASPGNILSTRGREAAVLREGGGVALGDLTAEQRDMARRLIEVYTTETLPRSLARVQQARLDQEDLDAVRFGWGGADLDGSIYYRLTGQTLLIEFATLVKQPQHLHAVFHDVGRNFGVHVL